ncbi:MAG: response regulator [Chloroflexota bacterium]
MTSRGDFGAAVSSKMSKTVLVADDKPNVRMLVSATIESDECEVVEACDGDEAWQLLQETRPCLAVLDVQMPGMTGIELTRAIREHPELSGTGIILLTAKAQVKDVEAGTAAGADFYLTKPFEPCDLLALVERVLAGEG